jgi:hypothetical protein
MFVLELLAKFDTHALLLSDVIGKTQDTNIAARFR